jgi:translocation and assembly module TamB
MAAARRVVMAQTNRVLASALAGTVRVDKLGAIGATRVAGLRFTVDDPEGKRVLDADQAIVEIDSLRLIASFLRPPGPIELRIRSASVRRLDLSLAADAAGLRLARAFAPRKPAGGPGREFRLHIDSFAMALGVHDGPRGASLDSRLRGRFSLARGGTEAHVSLVGEAAGVPLTLSTTLAGTRLDAVLDVPNVDAARISFLTAPLSPQGPATLHVEAHGTLPALDCAAHLSLGAASADLSAQIVLEPTLRMAATLRVGSLDAAALLPKAPKTSVDSAVLVSVTASADGKLEGTAQVDVTQALLDGKALPPMHLAGGFTQERATATVALEELRTQIALDAKLQPVPTVTFDVQTHALDLSHVALVAQLKGPMRGSVELHANGTVALQTLEMEATLDAALSGFVSPAGRVHKANLRVKAHGVASNPTLDVTLDARELGAGTVALSHASLQVTGSARQPHVHLETKGPMGVHAVADTQLRFEKAVFMDAAWVRVTGRGVTVRAAAPVVVIDGADVRVDNASLEGLGRPASFSLEKRGTLLHARLLAPSIDLGRLAPLLPRSLHLEGRLTARGDVTLSGAQARGEVSFHLRRGRVGPVTAIEAHVEASLEDRSARASADVHVPGILEFHVNAPHIGLAGPPLQASSWVRAVGAMEVRADAVLEPIAKLVTSSGTPEFGGTSTLHAVLSREHKDQVPVCVLTASTQGLVVARDGWRSSRIEVDVGAWLDPATHIVGVGIRLQDTSGPLVDASATAQLGDLTSLPFERIPLHVRATMVPRDLSSLPPPLQQTALRGLVDAALSFEGSIGSPQLTLVAHGRGLKRTAGARDQESFAVDLEGRYDGTQAQAVIAANGSRGQALVAVGDARVLIQDLLHTANLRDLPWKASMRASLGGVQLENIPALASIRVAGAVTGEVTVEGLHDDATARAELRIDGLRSGKIRNGQVTLRALLRKRETAVSARIDHGDGNLELTAKSSLHWGKDIVPRLEGAQPIRLAFHASSFRIGGLAPYVQATMPDLDGRLDASIVGTVGPLGTPPSFEGTAQVHEGKLDLPTFGEQLRNLQAHVAITRSGTVTVDQVSADAHGGGFTASARVQLRGTSFTHAEATVEIAQGASIPVGYDGDSIGEVWGRLELKVDNTVSALVLDANLPSLHVRMPDLDRRSVQSLKPAQGVQIGVRRTDGKLVAIGRAPEKIVVPPRTKPVQVTVRFGRDVEIRIGTLVRVALQGTPTIVVTDTVRVNGQLQLANGKLDVEGKLFAIDTGTVTFGGDTPSNPTVEATASWTAPNGTRVFADFIGPVSTGKLILRSEPSLSPDEILALVLFGTTEGVRGPTSGATSGTGTGTTQKATATAGASVGMAVATQGLNKALGQLTAIDISTRVDTSRDTPRLDVVWQVGRNLSAQLGTVLGTPSPGTNPDRNFLSIDWHFLGKWSAEATVGDAGTSMVDLLWSHRY